MSRTPRPARRLAVALTSLALVGGLAACGDDTSTSDSADSGVTTTADEYQIVPAAEVAQGLTKLGTLLDEVTAAGSDATAAGAARDEMGEVWEEIEGTVKEEEPDIYVDIEDSLSLISAGIEGDEAKGATGAEDLRRLIAQYQEAHPA